MLAAFGLPVALVREVGEVGVAFRGANDHAAAVAAVPAVGPAPRRVFLAPEAQAAVAARPSLHENGHSIDEHRGSLLSPRAASAEPARHGITLIRRPPGRTSPCR